MKITKLFIIPALIVIRIDKNKVISNNKSLKPNIAIKNF